MRLLGLQFELELQSLWMSYSKSESGSLLGVAAATEDTTVAGKAGVRTSPQVWKREEEAASSSQK